MVDVIQAFKELRKDFLDIINQYKNMISYLNEELNNSYSKKSEGLLTIKEAREILHAGTQLTRELAELEFIDHLQFNTKYLIVADSIPAFIDKYRNQDIRELIEERRAEKRNKDV